MQRPQPAFQHDVKGFTCQVNISSTAEKTLICLIFWKIPLLPALTLVTRNRRCDPGSKHCTTKTKTKCAFPENANQDPPSALQVHVKSDFTPFHGTGSVLAD